MNEVIQGRYGLAHGNIIASLLTEHVDDSVFFRVMTHVRELERERDHALSLLASQATQLPEG